MGGYGQKWVWPAWSQDSKIGCISKMNRWNELIFVCWCKFRSRPGQKWAWSFSSWDPKICQMSLWIELVFCVLTWCNNFWLDEDRFFLSLTFKCQSTTVVLKDWLGKKWMWSVMWQGSKINCAWRMNRCNTTDFLHADTDSQKSKADKNLLGWHGQKWVWMGWFWVGQSGHGTLKLTVSYNWADGINWFFAFRYKFTKSWFSHFWVGLVKNASGFLVAL